MSDGIYIALSGAVGETNKLDIVSNNLGNSATVGYQRVRPVFHEVLSQAGAAISGTTTLDTTRGASRVTGRALDVSLPDGTYLALGTPRGERYTRAGSMTVAPSGALTLSGSAVLAENGTPIKAAPDRGEVTITRDGEVKQDSETLGRVKLVNFRAPTLLAPEGGALLASSTGSGQAALATNGGQLTIGSLEESNTSVIGSMTDLVSASRSFDAFQRAIDAFRTADQKVTSSVPNADE
jgi:flagellar basal-body rod protein FlgF